VIHVTCMVQVYYKLFGLSLPRLKLIRLFLKAMAGEAASRQIAKIEHMLPGLNRSVDMSAVSILSWYDKCAYEAGHNGVPLHESLSMGTTAISRQVTVVGKLRPKRPAFLPHYVSASPVRASTPEGDTGAFTGGGSSLQHRRLSASDQAFGISRGIAAPAAASASGQTRGGTRGSAAPLFLSDIQVSSCVPPAPRLSEAGVSGYTGEGALGNREGRGRQIDNVESDAAAVAVATREQEQVADEELREFAEALGKVAEEVMASGQEDEYSQSWVRCSHRTLL
jgi:hypothetical protein